MDLNTARQGVINMQNINPADFTMAGKQYWAPVVEPLIKEGGDLFSSYFSALPNELLKTPGETMGYSPEYAVANALNKTKQAGSLYSQNLGLRDYFRTRAEDLGQTAMDAFKTKYSMAKDLYTMLFGEDQAAKEQALKERSLSAQYSSQNSIADLLKTLRAVNGTASNGQPISTQTVGGYPVAFVGDRTATSLYKKNNF